MVILTRRKVLTAAAAVGLGFASYFAFTLPAAAQAASKQQFISLATSTVGGSWFPLGGAMAGLIGKALPQLNISVEVTGGTVDNLKLIKNRKVELAYATADQAFLAYRGQGSFDSKIDNIRGLLGGHAIAWQLATLKDRGINSIKDLRGKRVSLGAAGSIGNSIGQLVIEAHGLKMNTDWKPEFIGHAQGVGALRDGQIDAVLTISSLPVANMTDLTSSSGADVVFLMPDPAVLAALRKDRPYWSPATIKAGTYKGHDKDIPGPFAVSTILIADKSLPDDTVHAIVKTLLENNAELTKAHSLGREWTTESALNGVKDVIPFHPGAEKYLKEKGLL